MAVGRDRYADVLAHLQSAGLRGSFTQTGGMCTALEIVLDSGHALVTDVEDSLAWDRADHRGWGVGLYPPASEYDGECLVYRSCADGSAQALPPLIRTVLDGHLQQQRRRH
jgi:hypothetical protein